MCSKLLSIYNILIFLYYKTIYIYMYNPDKIVIWEKIEAIFIILYGNIL